eukprot:gene2635-3039_t
MIENPVPPVRLGLDDMYADEHEVCWGDKEVVHAAGGVLRTRYSIAGVKDAKWITLPHHARDQTDSATSTFDDYNTFLCVLHEGGLALHNTAGKTYAVVLPCAIASVWPTPYGMLLARLERDAKARSNIDIPALFSVLHPLEELKPVLVSSSDQSSSFFHDIHQTIIYSSPAIPLLVTLDARSSSYVIYHISRRPSPAKTLASLTRATPATSASEPTSLSRFMAQFEQSDDPDVSFIDKSEEDAIFIDSDLALVELYRSAPMAGVSAATSSAFTVLNEYQLPMLCIANGTSLDMFAIAANTNTVSFIRTIPVIKTAVPITPKLLASNRASSRHHLATHILAVRPNGTMSLYWGSLHLSLVNHTSPVLHLKDPVLNRVTCITTNQQETRIKIDITTSPLVASCLAAITELLPPSTIPLIIEAFTQQSSQSTDEWTAFQVVMASIMGNTRPRDQSPVSQFDALLQSAFHARYSKDTFLASIMPTTPTPPPIIQPNHQITANFQSSIAPHTTSLLIALHCLYEEFKLLSFDTHHVRSLAPLLIQISLQTNEYGYFDHYCRDFGELASIGQLFDHVANPKAMDAPSIQRYSISCLNSSTPPQINYPLAEQRPHSNPFKWTRRILVLYQELALGLARPDSFSERIVLCMTSLGVTLDDLNALSFGLALPLREAIKQCRESPPLNWPIAAYTLISRQDLVRHVDTKGISLSALLSSTPASASPPSPASITSLLFASDLRMAEVSRLLSFSTKTTVVHQQETGVSDHDYLAQLQARLLLAATRTLALPIGAGALSIGATRPLPTETIGISPIVLAGTIGGGGNIALDPPLPPDTLAWPEFHAGVAAGLALSGPITNTWIVYNRPQADSAAYAGLLLALGLQGKLSSLAFTKVFEYLSLGHQLTSVGLLLGIASTKRATMEMSVAKILSVHIPSLHPPASIDLEVPSHVQIAAVLGMGLLYEGTANRRMTEVLLLEIGRRPTTDRPLDRDSYALSAGLALGLVNLGRGGSDGSLADLAIDERLKMYMGEGSDAARPPARSNLVQEGTRPNFDITSPGAILALALIHLKSNDTKIASFFTIPDTSYGLNFVRTDFLLLRVLAKSLVLWDSVKPTNEWIDSQINVNIKKMVSLKANSPQVMEMTRESEDGDLFILAYCNIVAGAAMAMGIRFAGTADSAAFATLMSWTNIFHKRASYLTRRRGAVDRTLRSTTENCLSVCALAVAVVMAGTGNVDALRILRTLRSRLGADVTYGHHMASALAIGLLFLGGGQYTLGSSNIAVAALVIALYPRFPATPSDNHYHLQALRHLYHLASEPRCLVARDVDTNEPVHLPVELDIIGRNNTIVTVTRVAPCLMPDPSTVKSIRVCSARYWPLEFTGESPVQQTKCRVPPTLFVKRKIGHLPHDEDPDGMRSLSKSFPRAAGQSAATSKEELLRSFSSDADLLAFARHFCADQGDDEINTRTLFECLTMDKPEMLGLHIQLTRMADDVARHAPITRLMSQLQHINSLACAVKLPRHLTTQFMLLVGLVSSIPSTSFIVLLQGITKLRLVNRINELPKMFKHVLQVMISLESLRYYITDQHQVPNQKTSPAL